MPDFKKMVRDRLHDCGLSPMRECEIVDEISQHLRDRYEAQLSNGANEDAAEREIVAELEGRDLARDLRKIEEHWMKERLLAILSGFFGLLAAILATVGLYGLMAYMVAKRTNEIGIRTALGATPTQMIALVLSEAGKLCGVGVAVGVVLALAVGRWAASLLFGLKPYNPAVLATACLGLALVAVLATTVPARRAANLQPMSALRED